MTYDVIIVGGGIQGVATAYELAKRGAGKILLLEKTILTGGSTGSCAAGIRASSAQNSTCASWHEVWKYLNTWTKNSVTAKNILSCGKVGI